MTVLDNPRYECFARLRAEGKSGTQAAIGAGYSERSARTQAARMFANDNVKARIAELQTAATDQSVESAGLTEAFVIAGLQRIAMMCDDPLSPTWNPSAAIRSLELLGKKLGLWVVRVDDRRRIDDCRSAEELDAAARELRREIDDLEERRARLLKESVSQ